MIKVLEKEIDFEKIIQEDKNVLVDFNATWCGPCRIMGREMEDLEDKLKDITFLKVDTDEYPEIAEKFAVVSIPTMVAFQDGKRINVKENGQESDILLGAKPEDEFESVLRETFGL